jgi:hypothetical protein
MGVLSMDLRGTTYASPPIVRKGQSGNAVARGAAAITIELMKRRQAVGAMGLEAAVKQGPCA